MHWQMETLRPDFIARARQQGLDDLGQPVRRLTARGGERLRDVLRQARPGEPLILASYCPFRHSGPYKEYGPVFLHAEAEGEPQPALAGLLQLQQDYLAPWLIVRAYDHQQTMIEAATLQMAAAVETLSAWGGRDDIAFAMLRFPSYGCYALRLDRPQPVTGQ